MFKCQITFQKYCYQCQISKFLQGRNWVLLFLWYNVVLRTVYNGTILRLKLDVPWGHIEEKKTLLPLGILNFLTVFRELLVAKWKNYMECTIEETAAIISAKLMKLQSHVS